MRKLVTPLPQNSGITMQCTPSCGGSFFTLYKVARRNRVIASVSWKDRMNLQLHLSADSAVGGDSIDAFIQYRAQTSHDASILQSLFDTLTRRVIGPDIIVWGTRFFWFQLSPRLPQGSSEIPSVTVTTDGQVLVLKCDHPPPSNPLPWLAKCQTTYHAANAVQAAITYCSAVNTFLKASGQPEAYRFAHPSSVRHIDLQRGSATIKCPNCKIRFSLSDEAAWADATHIPCGQKFAQRPDRAS